MKASFRIIATLPLIVVALSFAFAINSQDVRGQDKSAPRTEKSDRSQPILDLNQDSSQKDKAKTLEPKNETSADVKMRAALTSRFEERAGNTLAPNKTVLSCDAIEQLNMFASAAIDKVTTVGSKGVYAQGSGQGLLSEELVVSLAYTKFGEFLDKLRENGETLKDGRVLITGETVKATTLRICPLIPIC